MRGRIFDPQGDVRRILGQIDGDLAKARACWLRAPSTVSREAWGAQLDRLLDERLLAMQLRGSLG